MSLKIVSDNIELFNKIVKILTHYFPNQTKATNTSVTQQSKQQNIPQNLSLFINTKYYTCTVPIIHQNISINKSQNIQTSQKQFEQKQQSQALIFIFDQNEKINNIKQFLDTQVKEHAIQSVIICVNCKDNNNQWQYRDDVANCQNFISVVYQDLDKIVELLPKWSNNGAGLLKQQLEEQYEIFGILELLSTTQWTNITKKQIKSTSNNQKIVQNQQKKMKKQEEDNQIKQQTFQEQDDFDQQKMQKQMAQFQQMMQQMLQIKAMPIHGDQRKKKAGDLLLRLAGNMKD